MNKDVLDEAGDGPASSYRHGAQRVTFRCLTNISLKLEPWTDNRPRNLSGTITMLIMSSILSISLPKMN